MTGKKKAGDPEQEGGALLGGGVSKDLSGEVWSCR